MSLIKLLILMLLIILLISVSLLIYKFNVELDIFLTKHYTRKKHAKVDDLDDYTTEIIYPF